MRSTLDTNILVRAITSPPGPARRLIQLLRSDPAHALVLSRHILDEVREVLLRPRLQARYRQSSDEISRVVRELAAVAELVEPVVTKPVVLSDPPDDMVLYTAVEGRADVLCTLNTSDFARPSVQAFCITHGIRVMSDVELLRELLKYQPSS